MRLKLGTACTETHHITITNDLGGLSGYGRACDAFFKRFYEWRLWYVNECDWEKKNGISSFSTLTLPQSSRRVLTFKKGCTEMQRDLHDFNRWLCSEIMADNSYIQIQAVNTTRPIHDVLNRHVHKIIFRQDCCRVHVYNERSLTSCRISANI